MGFGPFPTAQGRWSFGAMGVSSLLGGACFVRRRRRLAMASVRPGGLRSFGRGALRCRPWPLPWRLLRAWWALLLGACLAPRRAGLCPRLRRRALLQVGRRTVRSCTVRFCPRASAAPSLCALSCRRRRALCRVLVPCVPSHCRPVCRAHATWTSSTTTTCARCGPRRGLMVRRMVVGVGRQWLWALGTAFGLRLLALWSSHLLCAATPRRAACTNRQIESTAAIALESQSLLCGARVGRLRPTRCLVPGFVAGRVRKQCAVASLR